MYLKDLGRQTRCITVTEEMLDEAKRFRAEAVDGVHEGFMKYTDEEIAQINGGLNEYLIKMLYNK